MDVRDKDQKLWEGLKRWQDIEPSSGYVSHFWTRLGSVTPWYQKAWKNVTQPWTLKPAFSVLATLSILILIGAVIIKNHTAPTGGNPEVIVLNLSDDEVKMLENFDLAESYDIIKDIDFWESLELDEDLERTGG